MNEQNTVPEKKRSLFDILKKYEPGTLAKRVFSSLLDYSVRADKEKRMLELSLHFPAPVEKEDLYAIEEALEAEGYAIMSAEKDKIPSNYVSLSSEDDILKMNRLLDSLEENEDVTNVWHNWENEDEE